MRKLILLAMLVVGCGSEDGKPIDPGAVEVSRIDVKTYDINGDAEIKIQFDSALPLKNLDYYGWYGMVAISDTAMPTVCDQASHRAYLLQSVSLSGLKFGKYYMRSCAGNNRTGYVSPGITKEFELVDEFPNYP